MKKIAGILVAMLVVAVWSTAYAGEPPTAGSVRCDEFSGAWMQTVYQTDYASRTTEQNKRYLRDQLDRLRRAGITAVLFQVRPSADAFYNSKLEPWSRFLSKDGRAPKPYWDPLEFMVEEAHARGMELHAWINPYRVSTSKKQRLPKGHIYHRHPERFVRYADGLIYFDPGIPENRKWIVEVVSDIASRYDIDGVHFDDYFYPYPVAGKDFPDGASYKKYGKKKNKAAWRRENVDNLIADIHGTLRKIGEKKHHYIEFGVSPFGIWRNKTSDPRGSETSGLQNYDDLYADPLLWAEKGWVDYLIPQIYWENTHKRAPYTELILWWATNVDPRCKLYIGQDVERTMKSRELRLKTQLATDLDAVKGNCWWPAGTITANTLGVADSLRVIYR